MNFNVHLTLDKLRCVQPDEGADEPYLWTFFFKLDGSTVHQTQPNQLQLIGNVHIATGPGSHGNLGAEDVQAGRIINIPPALGQFSTTLRPIKVQAFGQTVLIPGRLVSVCILMEEDATQDDSIEKAHGNLRDFLESQFNNFIATGITQTTVVNELAALGLTVSAPGAIQAAVQSLLNKFTDSLEGAASDLVQNTVKDDSSIFELIANFFDADDEIGTSKIFFDEKQIIQASLHPDIDNQIIRTEDGQWTAFYDLFGHLTATLSASSDDFTGDVTFLPSSQLDSGEFVFTKGAICIPDGTKVQWKLVGSPQKSEIRFLYPYLPVRWSINDMPLSTPSGSLAVTAECSFPSFDGTNPPRLVKTTSSSRTVQVRFEIADEGDAGKVLRLWNDPKDGRYNIYVDLTGIVPGGPEIALDSELVSFSGQAISIGPPEFWDAFKKCEANIASFGHKYAKFKHPTVKDLWDPHSRVEIYQDLVKQIDEVGAVRGVNKAKLQALKLVAAQKLQLNAGSINRR